VEKPLPAPDEDESSPDRHTPTLNTKDAARDRWLDPLLLPRAPVEGVGSRIGPYKLLQQIGEGGMGAVFMAEQQEPVRRMVAVKVIKAGMDSAQIIARFEAERQALALMDHPNIAKVFHADTTASGRPYFVMELVKGIPITKYCDEQRLTLRQRLELFVPVCQAIQHAHQKGIIHRDIKPTNVLIAAYDGKPVPKVIDFGVAKAMGQKLTERTLFTGFGGIIGTLEYMSPEQAEFNSLDIDTRSDVYSLGVLLYELLTGTTPLTRPRLQDAALTEVLRLIREEEPPRPSTRLSATKDSLASVSAQRQMEPAALVKEVRGEVDWIVMKALEKDRSRRYETAIGLARDIQRYLADEPVEAGPPSTTYRLRKLAWKHRRSLATVAALLLLLIAGVVASTSLAVWALRAESEARTAEQAALDERNRAVAAEQETKRSEEDAKAVLGFFQDKVLSAGRPEGQEGGLGRDATLRQAVEAAEPEIAKAFADRPLVEASIRNVLGETYWYLGEYRQGSQQHEKALALRESLLGPDHPDTLSSCFNLATAYYSAGRNDKALPLLEQTLKRREAKLGPDHPDTLISRDQLALAYKSAGRLDEAISLHKQALQQMEAKLGTDHPDTLIARSNLATAYDAAGQFDEAIRLHQQTLKQTEAKFSSDHPEMLMARNNLAAAYRFAGRYDDAICLYQEALKGMEVKLGSSHPYTLYSMANLGIAYQEAGQLEKAIALLETALQRGRRRADGLPALIAWVLGALAQIYDQDGQLAKAEALHREDVEQRRRQFGPDDPRTARALAQLGANLLKQKKFADAEPLLRQCLTIREKKQPDEWTTFHARSLLGDALLGQKKYSESEPLLLKGYQGMKERESKIPKQDKARLIDALERLVQLYEANGNTAQADRWREHREKARSAAAKDASKK